MFGWLPVAQLGKCSVIASFYYHPLKLGVCERSDPKPPLRLDLARLFSLGLSLVRLNTKIH